MKQHFTRIILEWHKEIDRYLPWKESNNPYKVWLSEVILQQTRVEQGMPYYLAFVNDFPDVHALANASEDEVLRLWKGLGYYTRARNLHKTAKYVSKELNGEFPNSLEALKNLKGIGDYTAAAIASFAFKQPHAVVDGNVFRVLSRYFLVDLPIDSTEGKKYFKELANELITQDKPDKYNQAIMDFGALQCVPRNPDCQSCPLNELCVAFKLDLIGTLPVKAKKIKHRSRYFHFIVIKDKSELFLMKRTDRDIWQSLYQFPMIEKERPLSQNELMSSDEWVNIFGANAQLVLRLGGEYKQTLTHQKINAIFFEVEPSTEISQKEDWIKINSQILDNFAFPKVIDWYLSENPLY